MLPVRVIEGNILGAGLQNSCLERGAITFVVGMGNQINIIMPADNYRGVVSGTIINDSYSPLMFLCHRDQILKGFADSLRFVECRNYYGDIWCYQVTSINPTN